ncbi:MAG: response regulator [Nitrospira sp.]|nr:response regulator [Nitrospira sp.]
MLLLMVEDEEDTADLIRLNLEQAQYEVIHAKDGQSAQGLIDSMPPPDLVLLDIQLPVVSGLDLLTYIRKQAGWEEVPVAMLTSDNNAQDVKRALENGANDYILKPLHPQQLVVRINRLINLVG